MSMSPDNAIDEILVLASKSMAGVDVVPVRLLDVLRKLTPDLETAAHARIIDRLEAKGFGNVRPPSDDPGEREFVINESGLARAYEVMELRRPKSIREKLLTVSRSDWIAIAAFVVSVIALFKSN